AVDFGPQKATVVGDQHRGGRLGGHPVGTTAGFGHCRCGAARQAKDAAAVDVDAIDGAVRGDHRPFGEAEPDVEHLKLEWVVHGDVHAHSPLTGCDADPAHCLRTFFMILPVAL